MYVFIHYAPCLSPPEERETERAESDGKGVGSGGWQGEVGRERERFCNFLCFLNCMLYELYGFLFSPVVLGVYILFDSINVNRFLYIFKSIYLNLFFKLAKTQLVYFVPPYIRLRIWHIFPLYRTSLDPASHPSDPLLL